MTSLAKEFYQELYKGLPLCMADDRKAWAQYIVANGIDLHVLLDLAMQEPTIASRFLWLLSDVIALDPQAVFRFLPALFSIRDKMQYTATEHSFSRYWSIVGIPLENESEALNLLFEWLNDPRTKVSVKVHSMTALYKLIGKYPELRHELQASIEAQYEEGSVGFKSRGRKILKGLSGKV